MVAYICRGPVDWGWNERSASLRLFQIEQNNMTAKNCGTMIYIESESCWKWINILPFSMLGKWSENICDSIFSDFDYIFLPEGGVWEENAQSKYHCVIKPNFGDQSWPSQTPPSCFLHVYPIFCLQIFVVLFFYILEGFAQLFAKILTPWMKNHRDINF